MEDFLKGFFMFLFSEHNNRQKIIFFMQGIKLIASIYSSTVFCKQYFLVEEIRLDFSNIIPALCSYQLIGVLIVFGFYFFVFYDLFLIIGLTIYTEFFSNIKNFPLIKKIFKHEMVISRINKSLEKSNIDASYSLIKDKGISEINQHLAFDILKFERDFIRYSTLLITIICQMPLFFWDKSLFVGFYVFIFFMLPRLLACFNVVLSELNKFITSDSNSPDYSI